MKKFLLSAPTLVKKLTSQKAALFSGLLIGTSYMPFPPWALLICLIPLWYEVLQNRESFWKSFWRGWWTQFVLSLIGFYWISYVSHEYGFMPWPFAIFVLLLFASLVHIYIALATGAAQWLRTRLHLPPWAMLALMAGFTGLGEMWWPSVFPWNFGYPFLWAHSPIAQVSDVVGFQGLSLIVLFANAGLTWGIYKTKATGKVSYVLAKAAALIAVFIGLYFLGAGKKQNWQATDSKLQILEVQGNIGNREKYLAEHGGGSEQNIMNDYFNLTRTALHEHPDVDLVIWPETAVPDLLNAMELKNRFLPMQFAKFVQEIKKPILTGAFSRVLDAHGVAKFFNALFLYGPPPANSQDLQAYGEPYHKTDLLVFGEYTPLTETFPFLAKISPAGEGFTRGKGPQVIPFGEYKIGVQICYESLYPEFSSQLATLGADFFVNLTNDSWFGPTAESHQHMIMTLARGLEARRPLLRTTNTGITTAILADGTQLEKSPQFTPWAQVFEVPFKKNAPLTFYSQYGFLLPYLLLVFLAGVILIGRGRDRSQVS